MKKMIVLAVMGLLMSCSSEKSMDGGENALDQKFKEVDKIFADYEGADKPGAAVMIIQDGKVIFQKGYGMANLEENIPVTPKSDFRLASVTKEFTSMCILQLIERGQLTLETTLTDIFPEFPDYGKTITVKNILNHTSGLQDYEELIPEGMTRQLKDKDVLDIMEGVDSAYFAVGEKHQYSNTGYAILTQILEKITGEPFRDYLKKNIFDPLHMDSTLAYENGINEVPNRAYGYTIEADGNVIRTDQSPTSAVLGDGGIYTNLEDMYKWDQSLYTNQLLGQKYLDMAFTNYKTNDGKFMNYGFGWRLETYKGMDIIYHTGSSIGFRNIFYRIPSKNFSLVVLRNRDDGDEFSSMAYAHGIVDLFF